MNAPTFADEGPNPFVTDIETATLANDHYRTTLWTGTHLQMTVMNIETGRDIGLEVHPGRDQFLRVEAGRAASRWARRQTICPSNGTLKVTGSSSFPPGPGTTSLRCKSPSSQAAGRSSSTTS